MRRVKIDRYFVREKGRTYEILKFPFIKYMWTVEDTDFMTHLYIVDGCKEAFCQLRYAFAVLANFPDKIIYFPCKQEGIGRYYDENYNLVMCRPELQFKRSLWTQIKRKLDKNHLSGKFTLQYDRKKLDDYLEKGLWKNYKMEISDEGILMRPVEMGNKMSKEHFEGMIGDTVFMVLGRTECYSYHHDIAEGLDQYCSGMDTYIDRCIGWIVSDGNIYRMMNE